MAQANVEAVRALAQAFQHPEAMARLASGDVDLGLFDPEIEWDNSRMANVNPDIAQVYCGHEGVRTFWRRWLEAWRDLQFEIQDVREAGDEVVLLTRNQRQWGRHSGILTEFPPFGQVFTFREGKVVRVRAFSDQQSALEAVRLKG
jgi:ketosteroid isomerase-like protein